MSVLEKFPTPEKDDCILDYQAITKILPHRYPFLLVDKVLSFDEESKTIRAVKNVTFNEPFFQGHFPEEPVMPGVLQVEAMAQAFCIVMYLAEPEFTEGKRPAFMGVDKCRFRAPVRPGDTLELVVTIEKLRRGIGSANAQCLVNGKVVSDAVLTATMV